MGEVVEWSLRGLYFELRRAPQSKFEDLVGLALEEKASNRCCPVSLGDLFSSRGCQVVRSFHRYEKTGLERAVEERQLQWSSHSGRGPTPLASKCYKHQRRGASLRCRRRECSASISEGRRSLLILCQQDMLWAVCLGPRVGNCTSAFANAYNVRDGQLGPQLTPM